MKKLLVISALFLVALCLFTAFLHAIEDWALAIPFFGVNVMASLPGALLSIWLSDVWVSGCLMIAFILTAVLLLRNRFNRSGIVAAGSVAVLLVAVAVCNSCAYRNPMAAQDRALARASEAQQDANPLRLLGTAYAARLIQQDSRYTAEQKKQAYDTLYDVTYKYARAEGMTRRGARRYAKAFADDKIDDLKLTCDDFSKPTAGCTPAGP